jgi:hypothetical protein
MRLLLPLISIPILIYGRAAWACDQDDQDDDQDNDADEVEEAEAPEPPDPPDPPDAADECETVASADDGNDGNDSNDADVDIHWDIDVHWNGHGDEQRSQARQLVIDRIEDLAQQLDDATSELDRNDDRDD